MKKMIRDLAVVLLCFLSLSAWAQSGISGTVLDESGVGLPGATVLVKGTTKGTVTDIDGKFSLDAASEDVLVVTFVGYNTQEVPVGNQTEFSIQLELDIEQLEEVVVVGYGTMKKRDVTGAIAQVDNEELAKVRSANALEGIQGRVAGVDIQRSSGRAGAGYDILVRGQRSFSGNNDPLYIVDGIQFGTDNVNIDPNDIESMEILKDASSTAIYGSRGANGVVIITTKKGKKGKGQFSFNSYVGVTEAIGKVPLMNGEEFKQMYNDLAWMKDWQTDPNALPDPTGYLGEMRIGEDENADYDWYDGLLKNGMQQNYNLGFTGGADNMSYSSSISYYAEDGLITNDTYNRLTFRLNLEGKLSDWVSIGTSSLVSYTNQQDRENPFGDGRKLSPLSVPYDTAGNLIAFPRYPEEVRNPFINDDTEYHLRETKSMRSFTTFYAVFKLFNDALTYRPSINVDLESKRRGTFEAAYPGINGLSNATVKNTLGYDYTIQNILTFDKTYGDHSINVTGGSEIIARRNEVYYTEVQDLGLPNSQWYALSTGNVLSLISPSESDNPPLRDTRLVSFLGRAHYSYKGKYMVQFTGRYDGASQLAPGNKWAFFPSLSLAWNIADENFLAGVPAITDMKLRASYGISGSQAVKAYDSKGSVTGYPLLYEFGVSEQQYNGFRTDTNENNALSWENTTAVNIGLDFGFFSGRLTGNAEVYQNRTEGVHQTVTLSPHAGITSVVANIGTTEGRGFELSLNSVIIDNDDFTWNFGVNYFTSREEIVELAGGVDQDVQNGWFVGYPLDVHYGKRFTGIWQEDERDEAALFGLTPGDMKFEDINGDTLYSAEDRVILGTPRPDWTLGINTSVEYKGFDFTVLVFTRWGQMIRDRAMSSFSVDGLNNGMNHDYWTPFNPTNSYPRLDPRRTLSGYGDLRDLEFTDGSFVKVRDITLGYTVPQNVASRAGMSKLRVYLTVKNAFIFSDYYDGGNRYDPELKGSIDIPMPRLYAGGLNITF